MFDAMSCGDKNRLWGERMATYGERATERFGRSQTQAVGKKRKERGWWHRRRQEKGANWAENEGNCADEREPLASAPSSAALILPLLWTQQLWSITSSHNGQSFCAADHGHKEHAGFLSVRQRVHVWGPNGSNTSHDTADIWGVVASYVVVVLFHQVLASQSATTAFSRAGPSSPLSKCLVSLLLQKTQTTSPPLDGCCIASQTPGYK